jgi:hypothetical protein
MTGAGSFLFTRPFEHLQDELTKYRGLNVDMGGQHCDNHRCCHFWCGCVSVSKSGIITAASGVSRTFKTTVRLHQYSFHCTQGSFELGVDFQ